MSFRHALLLSVRRAAQITNLALDIPRRIVLAPFVLGGLASYPGAFDREYYRTASGAGGLRRNLPLLHFVFHGMWALESPNPGYSQVEMLRRHPSLRWPPFLNSLLSWHLPEYDPVRSWQLPAVEGRFPAPEQAPASVGEIGGTPPPAPVAMPPPDPPAAAPIAAAPAVTTPVPPVTAVAALEALWPRIHDDAEELSRTVSSITPTATMKQQVLAHQLSWPTASEENRIATRVLDQLPDQVDFLFVAPWLGIRGGGERSTERYFSALTSYYAEERIALLLPDVSDQYSPQDASGTTGIRTVSFNTIAPGLSQASREDVFNRVMVNLQPATVHCANALTAWNAIRTHGGRYRRYSSLFVALYSDIRVADGMPVGYYHSHFPYLLDDVAGVLCDNTRIIERAREDYSLSRDQMDRMHFVPTPIVGLSGGGVKRDFRRYTPGAPRRSLWMSRIAPEKRIDVLKDLASLLPDREFDVYGAVLKVSEGFDPRLEDHANIHRKGEFERLEDIPMGDFDSYVFTSRYEGMPLSVLEVVRFGLPVVAPDVGGIGDLIDGETGWLVSSPADAEEYASALAEIEQAPDEAERRVKNAQARLADVYSQRAFRRKLESIPGYLQHRP